MGELLVVLDKKFWENSKISFEEQRFSQSNIKRPPREKEGDTDILGLPPSLASSNKKTGQSPDSHLYNAEQELGDDPTKLAQNENFN